MPSWVVVGPGDDAAVLEAERGALDVLTTDALVEGVHFDRRFVPPDAIGHRALAVNLSDLAAMGARPRAALLSLALPGTLEVGDLDGIIDGFLALAGRHGVALIGGNITRSPGPMMLDVTATGSVGRRGILRRSGARPGDEVYVTGTLGSAAAGLQSFAMSETSVEADLQVRLATARERYLRPAPRVRAGALLGSNRAASSCMDLSDGLADGVRQLAAASEVGITIDSDALPIANEVREWCLARTGDAGSHDPVALALGGGDDYELLFTSRPSHRRRLRGVLRLLGDLAVTKIGVVTKGRDVRLTSADGERAMPAGFQHFGD